MFYFYRLPLFQCLLCVQAVREINTTTDTVVTWMMRGRNMHGDKWELQKEKDEGLESVVDTQVFYSSIPTV